MTENEAQKWLERFEWDDSEETSEALTTICEALQEVQEYQIIGTIEELKSMKENGAFTGVELAQLAAMQMRLKEYLAIGTIEEFKELKEKSMVKKPMEYEDKYYGCPNCGNSVMNKWEKYPTELKNKKNGLPYCLGCGQKLDWSE